MAEITECYTPSRSSPNWAATFAGLVAVFGMGEEAF